MPKGHENGQKSAEGEFKGGKREGLWTQWDEDGQKKAEGWWQDGELVRTTDF